MTSQPDSSIEEDAAITTMFFNEIAAIYRRRNAFLAIQQILQSRPVDFNLKSYIDDMPDIIDTNQFHFYNPSQVKSKTYRDPKLNVLMLSNEIFVFMLSHISSDLNQLILVVVYYKPHPNSKENIEHHDTIKFDTMTNMLIFIIKIYQQRRTSIMANKMGFKNEKLTKKIGINPKKCVFICNDKSIDQLIMDNIDSVIKRVNDANVRYKLLKAIVVDLDFINKVDLCGKMGLLESPETIYTVNRITQDLMLI